MDIFLELPCFLHDPSLTNVGNLNSGFSTLSKSSLYIWKFLVRVLQKLAWRILSILCYYVKWVQLYGILNLVWHCPSLGLEWKLTFSNPVGMLRLPNLLTYWVQHFNIVIFYGFNSSAEILSPPLALLVVKWKSLSSFWFFATPWTIKPMEFSRPDYWSG